MRQCGFSVLNRRNLFQSLAMAGPAQALRGAVDELPQTLVEGAQKLLKAALDDAGGWRKLEYVCDRIGHRLSGSEGMRRSIDWAAAEMKRDGLENVQTPLVKVPHWVRGEESAMQLEPLGVPLAMLGLGGSIATPAEGITAEVIAVKSFDELEALGAERVRGKIVLYAVPWDGYGRTVRYRGAGASRAARLGAVAALVRSMTGVSLGTPHTGMLQYSAGAPKIPAAAVSVEDAERIARLCAAGAKVTVRLKMSALTLPDADSANVIGDLSGREKPEEIVVLGGHWDSWDVGQGAHDDAAGCIACWQAVVLMKQLGLRPRRTVRAVLWANEENGLRGGPAYREWAGEAVKDHVAAIEMDGGSERPVGFGLGAPPDKFDKALGQAKAIARLLDGIGAGRMTAGGGGADIGALMRAGVPGFGHQTAMEKYFNWHHTEADTLDKVDPQDFRLNIAALAVLAWGLAEMEPRLGA